MFSFNFINQNNLDIFNYIFPLLSPFEGDDVYIFSFSGNLVRGWGGYYNGQIASSVKKNLDFFFFLTSSFFSIKKWDDEIFYFINFYFRLKNLSSLSFSFFGIKSIFYFKKRYFLFQKKKEEMINSLSSNLNIINARKTYKIY